MLTIAQKEICYMYCIGSIIYLDNWNVFTRIEATSGSGSKVQKSPCVQLEPYQGELT